MPGIKNSGNEIIAAKQTNLLDADSAKVNSADKADEDTKSQNMTVINKTSADVVLTDQTHYRAKSVADYPVDISFHWLRKFFWSYGWQELL